MHLVPLGMGQAATGIFVAKTQILTKFNSLDLTVEDATLSRAWQVSVDLCSPHAAQGPAAGGIGFLGFHLSATKHFRRVFL